MPKPRKFGIFDIGTKKGMQLDSWQLLTEKEGEWILEKVVCIFVVWAGRSVKEIVEVVFQEPWEGV